MICTPAEHHIILPHAHNLIIKRDFLLYQIDHHIVYLYTCTTHEHNTILSHAHNIIIKRDFYCNKFIITLSTYSRSQKTVTFSFRSVPLERKWNTRSSGKKQSVPFPETVIERWAAPHIQLFTFWPREVYIYSSITVSHVHYSTAV